MSASPQFIPIKKGRECFAVQSWRESPSLKPASSPAPPPPPLPPPLTPPPTPNSDATDSSGKRKPRGRGKSLTDGSSPQTGPAPPPPPPPSAAATKDPLFEDFYLRCVVPGVALDEVEQLLLKHDLKPLKALNIGKPRAVPLKRFDDSKESSSPTGGDAIKNTPKSAATPAAVVRDAGDPDNSNSTGSTPPSMNMLPPNVPANLLATEHLWCLLYAEQEPANQAAACIAKKWPNTAVTEVVPRKRSSLNASLVIKGLPFTVRSEKLVEELEHLSFKPSYVRLHRGERGVFKCVVFVKYNSRSAAEVCKLELERLLVGSRPLKVEFKKKYKEELAAAAAAAAPYGGGSAVAGASRTSVAVLEQAVRDLRFSSEHEGFFFTRTSLGKDDVKYLKHLAQSFDMTFEGTAEVVTVKRRMVVEKPSPALRPAAAPGSTPPWVPATPGTLQPMEFRGIRHWKEMRLASAATGGTALGIVRPVEPGTVPAFGSGRGRPIAS